ncbi:MAG: putative zinc-binding peptidase [Dehalococcoidia bacterium]
MKLFECQYCGQLLGFENTRCERCGHLLGYLPEREVLSALGPGGVEGWRPLADVDHLYRFCANDTHSVCNWLVRSDSPEHYCQACRLNRTIPNLSEPRHVYRWQRLEWGKHRLVYGLMRLGLPLTAKRDHAEVGLAFDFLSPDDTLWGQPVTTGHNRGLITLNIAEADDAEREQLRANLAEPYRTVLGHFRHEVGHYYWERLIEGEPLIERFRALFGDERRDYASALEQHYNGGMPPDWNQRHISTYAAAHPWEDWAETWAHYLHMVDTLETAYAFGLSLAPRSGHDIALSVIVDFDPYEEPDFGRVIDHWLPVVYAGNSLNRSMGQQDLYPFVLTPGVLEKLRFVHEVARGNGSRATRTVPAAR